MPTKVDLAILAVERALRAHSHPSAEDLRVILAELESSRQQLARQKSLARLHDGADA